MQRLVKAAFLLLVFFVLHAQAFADAMNCQFKDARISGIKDIHLTEDALILNGRVEIALEKTKIRCGALNKRDRYEGMDKGFQVILRDCAPNERFEGHLIDAVKQEVAEIHCE